MKYGIKQPLESYTRSKIEERLKELGYNMDEKYPDECNVYRERAKYENQDRALKGKNPDFLIYKKGSSEILAVIEAKRPSVSLEGAIAQAIELYATPLSIPIVFVYNSGAFYACSIDRKPVKIDHIEISDFVDEQTLIDLIQNGYDIDTVPPGFSVSRDELLKIFKKANDLLRKAGLRDGYERFSVFSDLMFLKLKNDFSEIGDTLSTEKELDKSCTWKKLIEKTPKYIGKQFKIEDSEVKSYLEDTVKKKLKESYGDVFESSLNIKEESILIELIELIDTIPALNIDSDVKGDAFEFFLKNVTNGNKDLGEYYTPRHIVKMVVKLLNPTYGEKIYDPCCGTGGFLLECFRYLREHSDISIESGDSKEDAAKKTERRKVIREQSIFGREITSTSRIAKMNMILFGDGHTHIKQMDCLSSVVDGEYDVVVSNIPYSQKVEYGALYDFPTTNGDSLFMQHIWKAVKTGGRMAVVVPETFLYGEDTFDIRKKIINESSHIIIISLPRGVFNPYTPTKTSIIVAYKKKKSQGPLCNGVYSYIVRNDGFELGARRRPLPGTSDCNKFLMAYNADPQLRNITAPDNNETSYEQICENNYNLLPFAYMEHLPWGIKESELTSIGENVQERNELFSYNGFRDKESKCVILSVTQNGIYVGDELSVEEMNLLSQKYKRVYPGDFTYNPHRINVGSIGIVPKLAKYMYVSYIYPVFYLRKDSPIPPYHILRCLKSEEYKSIINDYCIGGARADLKYDLLGRIKIRRPNDKESKEIEACTKKMERAYGKYISLMNALLGN